MNSMNRRLLRKKVEDLRKEGKTYQEIQKKMDLLIPKSTLSFWCKKIDLPHGYKNRIDAYNKFNLVRARKIALALHRVERKKYLNSITERNRHLKFALKNKDTAKIVLAILYLGEGSKGQRGSLMFGNSDPFIISLFVRSLRYCYSIDERKFRCTLQCRADQNIKKLELFWSRVTKIPLSQFYKARVDPRTINKPSKKKDYKGVCRVDYFSADLFFEITKIPEIINKGL